MTRIFSFLIRSKVLVLTFIAVWGFFIEPASAFAGPEPLTYTIDRQVLLSAQEQAQSLPTGVRFAFPFGDRVVVSCETMALTRGPGFRCEFIFGDKSFTITDAEFKSIDCLMGAYSVDSVVKVKLGEQVMHCKPTAGESYNYSCSIDPSTLKDTSVAASTPAPESAP